MFLDRSLRATRDNVIDKACEKVMLGDKWIWPASPQYAIDDNRDLLRRFLSGLTLHTHEYLDRRQSSFRIRAAHGVPLRRVHEDLLTEFRLTESRDSFKVVPLLRLVQHHL